MAPPIYFLASVTRDQLVAGGRLNRPLLAARGLDGVFGDVGPVETDCYLEELVGTGPGSAPGTLLAALPTGGAKPVRLGFFNNAELQQWTMFRGQGGVYYVGLDRHDPPTPADLARSRQLAGYAFDDGAGRRWQVPVIRDAEASSGLPSDWLLDEDGRVQVELQSAYRQVWDEFAGVVDLFYGESDDSPAGLLRLDRADALRWSMAVLGINYRFGRAEQNLLHVIDSDNWARLLSLAVDVPTFYAVYRAAQEQKKKRPARCDPGTRPASPATGPGPPGAGPGTSPAAGN